MPKDSNEQPNSGKCQVFHLNDQSTGETLVAALKRLLAPSSWGEVRRLLSSRHIDVNGNLCLDEARRVKETDVIRVWEQPLPKPIDTNDVRLAFLDEHLLVVEKPAGVNSVRHVEERMLPTKRRQLQPTLDELLPPVLAKIQRLRWPPLPPKGMNKGTRASKSGPVKGSLPIQNAKKLPPELQVLPVHRLDRNTSGLMLFAKRVKPNND